jgi:hypothetical protein
VVRSASPHARARDALTDLSLSIPFRPFLFFPPFTLRLPSAALNTFHYPHLSPLLLFGCPPSSLHHPLHRFLSERLGRPQNQFSPILALRSFSLSFTPAGITLVRKASLREAASIPFFRFLSFSSLLPSSICIVAWKSGQSSHSIRLFHRWRA